MARRRLTEKEKLYAKVILDFANAKDTNKAGLQYIENIQRAYGLPDEFKKGALEGFPVQPDAKNLISEIVERKEKIKKEISSSATDIEETGHCFLYNEDVCTLLQNPYVYTLQDDVPNNYDYTQSTSIQLTEIRKARSMRSFVESESEFIHYNIFVISCSLNDLLSCLYNNESFLASDQINSIIDEYKESYDINISTHLKITERPIVPEGYIFNFNVEIGSMDDLYDALRTLYKKPISYCLVTLLKIDDFRKRLKKCKVCSDFFLSYDGKLRCSENCQEKHKRIYMRDYMKGYPR